jgi:hypothetical protein
MAETIEEHKFAHSETEAARLLSVSTALLRKQRCDGSGPKFCRYGRRVLYRPEDLKSYLAAKLVTSTSEAIA